MRVLPNMLIAAPGDPMEVRGCMRYIINNPQPSYLRLGKVGEPCLHAEVPEVSPGQWLNIRAGKKHGSTYLTTGGTLDLVNQLIAKNPDLNYWSLNSMPLWSMDAKKVQVRQVEDFAMIVTVEDHLKDGGFGSWLLEAISTHPDLLARLRIKSLDAKVCGMVGKQSMLNTKGGLAEEIVCA